MGPSGFPPTFIAFRHFFPPPPHLSLHSGVAAPALRQATAAPSQPCRPCQAARLARVLPVTRKSNNSSSGLFLRGFYASKQKLWGERSC